MGFLPGASRDQSALAPWSAVVEEFLGLCLGPGRSWDPLVMSASGVGEESGGKRAVSLPVMSWSHLKAPSGSDGL